MPSSMRTMRRSSAPTYNLAYVKCAIGHYFRLGGAPAQPARPHWQRLQCQFVSTFLTQRRAYSISCTHFKDISKASMAAPIVEPVAFPPYAIDRAMYTEQRQRLAASMEVKFPGQAVAAIFRGETEIDLWHNVVGVAVRASTLVVCGDDERRFRCRLLGVVSVSVRWHELGVQRRRSRPPRKR